MVPIFNLTYKVVKRCKPSRLNFKLSHILLILITLFFAGSACFGQGHIHLPEVHEEPRHQVVWENDQFRFLNVYILPGDSSLMHIHTTPIAYVAAKTSCVYIEYTGKAPKEITLPDGWTGYDFYRTDSPFIHRIAPCRGDTLHVYAIQMKNDPPESADKKDFEFGFQTRIVSKGDTNLKASKMPVVFKSGSATHTEKILAPGVYILPSELKNLEITGESEFWEILTNR